MRWDVFCRVIDNHGDLGVCWRLARSLADLGEEVRLVVDDARALAWMSPDGVPDVEVLDWTDDPLPDVGDVVIEAFGCDPPAAHVARMTSAPRAPVWINLEYLSAEADVERSHGLPSPQRNGLVKWFCYPGFTAATGGLLREPDSTRAHSALHGPGGRDLLAGMGIPVGDTERVVSLFCYPQPRLAAWLHRLSERPTLLLVTPDHAARQLADLALPPGLRLHRLPWLDQPSFGRLLAACDLNIVRGEDSFVQAHWASRPLLWHIYPQHDGAHGPKLEAWLDRLLGSSPAAHPELAARIRAVHRHWNGLDGGGPSAPAPALPDLAEWAALHRRWADHLTAGDDLVTRLLHFVATRQARQVPPTDAAR